MVQERIGALLHRIERDNQVSILFAVESGSRAWGFDSPDSDYDVRFVYAAPVRDYLQTQRKRDVIELPLVDDLDVNGWDLFKALGLFRASNPPLLEWLHSPITYLERGDFRARLVELAAEHYSMRRMTYHYLSMARGNANDYILGKERVRLKKYLYALRPLLCIRWMEQQGTPPPTSAWETLEGVALNDEVGERIRALMERKRMVGEVGEDEPDLRLNAFLESEIVRLNAAVSDLPDGTDSRENLDRLAWEILGV